MLPKIEQLQAEDEAIEQLRAQLSQLIGRVGQHAPKLEPDEEKAQKYTKSIVDQGTAFLTQVRETGNRRSNLVRGGIQPRSWRCGLKAVSKLPSPIILEPASLVILREPRRPKDLRRVAADSSLGSE